MGEKGSLPGWMACSRCYVMLCYTSPGLCWVTIAIGGSHESKNRFSPGPTTSVNKKSTIHKTENPFTWVVKLQFPKGNWKFFLSDKPGTCHHTQPGGRTGNQGVAAWLTYHGAGRELAWTEGCCRFMQKSQEEPEVGSHRATRRKEKGKWLWASEGIMWFTTETSP